jgi:hypothetical protein
VLKPVRSIVSALAVALITVSTAAAITGGAVDGDAHPYVGALVVDGAVQCSGVLISPTVFATAGHCAADGSRVSVSFDSKLGAGWNLVSGTLEVDASRRADLAVVVLDAPTGVVPATLPAAGSAESLARRALVTSVGYGYSGWAADGSFLYDGYRRVASSPVLKVSKSALTLSTSIAGPCLGDSGGPQLSGNTVLSLTSGGSADCTGRAEGYRLDTTSARAFLGSFVTLP